MVGTESDNACSIAAFFSFTYLAKSISAFVSATAIASIRNVLFSLRFPVALEEEEEEEENPTSDDETFLFEEEEAEEEDIEIREEKELKNVIDEVDATVKTLILRAHVSKFN